jgi:hypothetical protein
MAVNVLRENDLRNQVSQYGFTDFTELTLNNKIFNSVFQYHGRKLMKNYTNFKKRQERGQHVQEQLNGKWLIYK